MEPDLSMLNFPNPFTGEGSDKDIEIISTVPTKIPDLGSCIF